VTSVTTYLQGSDQKRVGFVCPYPTDYMPPREARILFSRVDRGLSHHPALDLDLDLDRDVDHAERHKEPE